MGFETLSLLILLYFTSFVKISRLYRFQAPRYWPLLETTYTEKLVFHRNLLYMEIIITPEIGIGFTSNLQHLLIFISQFETHTENLGTTSWCLHIMHERFFDFYLYLHTYDVINFQIQQKTVTYVKKNLLAFKW